MTDAFHNLYNYKFTMDKVIDGDTVKGYVHVGMGVTLDPQNFRLFGIDTPEKRGEQKPYGLLVKDKLIEKLEERKDLGESLYIRSIRDKKGKYGRYLIELLSGEGFSFNKWLVNSHYAVEYHGKSKDLIQKEHAKNRALVMGS